MNALVVFVAGAVQITAFLVMLVSLIRGDRVDWLVIAVTFLITEIIITINEPTPTRLFLVLMWLGFTVIEAVRAV